MFSTFWPPPPSRSPIQGHFILQRCHPKKVGCQQKTSAARATSCEELVTLGNPKTIVRRFEIGSKSVWGFEIGSKSVPKSVRGSKSVPKSVPESVRGSVPGTLSGTPFLRSRPCPLAEGSSGRGWKSCKELSEGRGLPRKP